jgi:hypothetical protein
VVGPVAHETAGRALANIHSLVTLGEPANSRGQ